MRFWVSPKSEGFSFSFLDCILPVRVASVTSRYGETENTRVSYYFRRRATVPTLRSEQRSYTVCLDFCWQLLKCYWARRNGVSIIVEPKISPLHQCQKQSIWRQTSCALPRNLEGFSLLSHRWLFFRKAMNAEEFRGAVANYKSDPRTI